MTECTFDMTNLTLKCVGHATESGEDSSICTALTTLVLTLAYDIDEAADMCAEKEIEIKPGYYYIRVKPKEEAQGQMEFLFTAFINGIYMLSEDTEISKHITLTVTM